MTIPRNPQIRKIGVDLSRHVSAQKAEEGLDYPAGIEKLDLEWFEKSVTIDSIANCKNELELVRLQNDALWIIELRRLKKLALDN